MTKIKQLATLTARHQLHLSLNLFDHYQYLHHTGCQWTGHEIRTAQRETNNPGTLCNCKGSL